MARPDIASLPSPQDTIKDAFDKLDRELFPTDGRYFHSITIQDVWNAARSIESEQATRSSLQNTRRIMPLLEGLGKFGGVLDTLCQGTPFLCYIWVSCNSKCCANALTSTYPTGPDQANACCKSHTSRPGTFQHIYVVQIFDGYKEAYEELINAYAELAKNLPRFDRLSHAFRDKVEFQLILADVYSDLLDFHRGMYKIARRGG